MFNPVGGNLKVVETRARKETFLMLTEYEAILIKAIEIGRQARQRVNRLNKKLVNQVSNRFQPLMMTPSCFGRRASLDHPSSGVIVSQSSHQNYRHQRKSMFSKEKFVKALKPYPEVPDFEEGHPSLQGNSEGTAVASFIVSEWLYVGR
eukprot:TRINITY_DN12083_c0_g2_i1.p1 TRINITY_DN12083_c0_g2~~TRINITY_DN12083_c0_g2_i1.p1  ORF type:complete len:149 (-),score=3.83 TRINITY_DN12083_c0_g2_i1:367-813(-)